jgi:hypothetical protein
VKNAATRRPRKEEDTMKKLEYTVGPDKDDDDRVTVVTVEVSKDSVKIQTSKFESMELVEKYESDPHNCFDDGCLGTSRSTITDMSVEEIGALLDGMELMIEYPQLAKEFTAVKGLF